VRNDDVSILFYMQMLGSVLYWREVSALQVITGRRESIMGISEEEIAKCIKQIKRIGLKYEGLVAWYLQAESQLSDTVNHIKSLESELKEYKRCAVLGGDGKMIWPKKQIWHYSKKHMEIRSDFILSVHQWHDMSQIYIGHGPDDSLSPSDCYSTPDAVPGGDNE